MLNEWTLWNSEVAVKERDAKIQQGEQFVQAAKQQSEHAIQQLKEISLRDEEAKGAIQHLQSDLAKAKLACERHQEVIIPTYNELHPINRNVDSVLFGL